MAHCLGQAELVGATVTKQLLSCVAEPASRGCHHGATAVASQATETSSPRLSTLKTGLNTILKTNEREKIY